MVERECELARIRDVLANAAQGIGTVTVIESSAGTGRPRLLSAAASGMAAELTNAQIARGSGPGRHERLFDFGLVLQLFEQRWLTADADEHDHMFRGPARPAQALTGESARTTEAGAFARRASPLIHGLFSPPRNLAGSTVADAGTGPLVLLVDDVQRADSASVRFLAYLGNRIRTLPVALVVTARAGEPATDTDAVRALRDAASHRLHPAELSDCGARRVARDATARRRARALGRVRRCQWRECLPAARDSRGDQPAGPGSSLGHRSTRRARCPSPSSTGSLYSWRASRLPPGPSRPPSPHLATLRRLRLRRPLRVSTLTRQHARLTCSLGWGFCARVLPSRSATG